MQAVSRKIGKKPSAHMVEVKKKELGIVFHTDVGTMVLWMKNNWPY